MVLLQGYVGMPSSPLRCSLEFIFSCVSLSIIKGCKFRQMAFCLDACQTARLSQTMGAPLSLAPLSPTLRRLPLGASWFPSLPIS